MCEADFDEPAADPDDVARSPFFLRGAAVPEEGEEVLWWCVLVIFVRE